MFLLLYLKIIVTLENNPAIILNGTTALVTFCQGKWFKEHLHMSIKHFAMFRKLCLELHPSACPAKTTFDSWFSLSLKEFEGEMFSDLCFGVAGRDFDGLRKEVSGWDEAGELLCGGVLVWGVHLCGGGAGGGGGEVTVLQLLPTEAAATSANHYIVSLSFANFPFRVHLRLLTARAWGRGSGRTLRGSPCSDRCLASVSGGRWGAPERCNLMF